MPSASASASASKFIMRRRLHALSLLLAAAAHAKLVVNVSSSLVCAAATDVCGCQELSPGCGWCSSTETCKPADKCSTTCEECDSTCNNHQHCQDKCHRRFHAPRESPNSDADDGFTFPPSPQDINCAIGIFCATVLASAAGIGGGAVLVPLFTMIGEFTEHEAIPLSIATVFGASAFSTLGNFLWEKHPTAPHRPMIAYDAALVLLPMTLLGSTGGVFLNMVCPDWMIVGLLVALCAYSGQRTVTQAYKRREKENPPSARHEALAEALVGEQLDDGAAPEGHEREIQEGATTTKSSSKAIGEGVMSDALLRAKQLELLTHDESGCAWASLMNLCGTWVLVMGLSMLKGGHGAPSLLGVTCGTPGYWAVVLLNVPVLLCLTSRSGTQLVALAARKAKCGYQYASSSRARIELERAAGRHGMHVLTPTPLPLARSFTHRYAEGDVEWTTEKVWQYARFVGFGAIAAGMLGVGGGMILGPIFNELNFHPQVKWCRLTVMDGLWLRVIAAK